MYDKCVLLDTNFFIRLLNPIDAFHANVLGFFRHFLENGYRLKCSTISIAEYCVQGSIDQLPMKNLEILPFNIDHAEKAGELANLVYSKRDQLEVGKRLLVPNDTKLFAQAQVNKEIQAFATSDQGSIKIFNFLNEKNVVDFELINIQESYHSVMGILPFTD